MTGIKTEAEILCGSILQTSKYFDRRKDPEAVRLAVRSLRKEARTWINKKVGESNGEVDDVYAKESAWYHNIKVPRLQAGRTDETSTNERSSSVFTPPAAKNPPPVTLRQ
ncbi:hypothetical protein RJ639_047783 [Escallonia herrerae]|uniref:RDRP C-terminal head domain-containing protein n=1 Tax=Escallonia herrerae TaxID=1293975 RepID=A0AA88W6C4_9ASTE|nr:hypothetical protein RJ639_047783 [Escallonia herrerae]